MNWITRITIKLQFIAEEDCYAKLIKDLYGCTALLLNIMFYTNINLSMPRTCLWELFRRKLRKFLVNHYNSYTHLLPFFLPFHLILAIANGTYLTIQDITKTTHQHSNRTNSIQPGLIQTLQPSVWDLSNNVPRPGVCVQSILAIYMSMALVFTLSLKITVQVSLTTQSINCLNQSIYSFM